MRPFLFISIIEVVILIGFYIIMIFGFFIYRQSLIDDLLAQAEEDPNLLYYYDNEEAVSTMINIAFILLTLLIFSLCAIYVRIIYYILYIIYL